MKKIIFYNLFIFFVLIIIFLEFLFPYFFYNEKLVYEFHNDRTVTFISNEKLKTNTDEYNVEFKSNNFGFNDYDFKNKVDILILGDSAVEAIQVNREDHFAEYLKKELNLKVAKIGMSGYGNSHYFSNYLKFSELLKPELVIVINVFNDIDNNFCDNNTQNCTNLENICKIKNKKSFNKSIKFLKIKKNNNFEFTYAKKKVQESHKKDILKFLKKFQTYYSLRTIYTVFLKKELLEKAKVKEKENVNSKCKNVLENNFATNYYKDINKIMVNKIVNLDKKKILFVNTNYHQFNNNNKSKLKFIKESFDESKYPHINLDEEFFKKFKIKDETKTNFQYDGHWNKYGHKLVGMTLVDYIKNNEIIKFSF